jgi:PAS domain S-box-containing protein
MWQGAWELYRKERSMSQSGDDQLTPSSVQVLNSINAKNSFGRWENKTRAWLALAIFMTGILLTWVAALYVKNRSDAIARKEFRVLCGEIKNGLSTRLHAHAQLLRSASALFEISGNISREQWHNAIVHQNIERNLPGIQGIGYSVIIPRAQLARHEQKIRNDGFPLYAVTPAGKRAVYTAIVFLEPSAGRNLRAFGYDMFSDPVRREAMELARDSDKAVLSGKVTLVQETDKDKQAGTLMYVPVYEKRLPVTTVEDRRGAIRGWVYSPYRMNDLLGGILGGWELREGMDIRLEVFSDESMQPEGLLYDSRPGKGLDAASASMFSELASIVFNDRMWSLRFTRGSRFISAIDYSEVWYVVAGGTALSSLLCLLFLFLVNAQASAKRYALTLDATNDGLWDWTVLSGRAFFSPHYYSLLGYRNGEFSANYASWRQLVHLEDLDRAEEVLRQSIKDSKSFLIDLRMKRKSGGWHWVSTRGRVVTRDAKGNALRMVGTLSDITERKAAEEALRESEQKHRRLFETMAQGVVYQASDGRIISANPAAERILGRSLDQLQGKTSLDPEWKAIREDGSELPGQEHPSMVTLGTGKPVRNFIMGVMKLQRNTPTWISVTAIPLFSPGETKPFQVYATFDDITDRKRVEDQLRGVREELDRSNQDLQQFASVASHDLQEPLRMVARYSQLLAERYEGQLDEKAKQHIAHVVEGAIRMQRLVSDILNYSRLGTRANAMKIEDSHIILGEAIINLTALIEENKAIITDENLPMVRADASQLVQVFQNLLSNAIKFRGEEIPRIHVSVKEEMHEWIFSVRDNGIGIDRQYAEKIFVIFQRLHTREEIPGTGIGLAVCKRIVERHGGRIWIESECGKGSTFFFTIPQEKTGGV